MLIKEDVCRNDSLGLCQCEKDEWVPIRKRSWSSSMRPYEQRFIDVKFIVQLSGSVTITLDEVLSKGWQYVFLLGGIALLFIPVRKALMFLKKINQQNQLEQGSVSEMASSHEFEEWVIRNAHRIRLRPKAD
ncbi:uncharacterized protein LOC143555517 [Bidens hawaiensis]|uniref:uncharacterized protein LOC143555517 n=1 Tax=Bidens hawaiensis TaxID=980011 RepID=UPI004048F184